MNWNTRKILRVCSLAMALMMTVMVVGMPIPQLGGGQPAVQTQPAVQDAEASATLVALGFMTAGVVAESVYDTYVTPRDPAEMSNEELKVAIAQDAYTAKQTQENYITDSRNALSLTKNDAKQEAYQTYINARMNGSSHSDAVTKAKNRVDDLYTKHQMQLMKKYETQVVQGGGYCSMAQQWRDLGNTTNVRFYDSVSGSNEDIRCTITDSQLGSDGLMLSNDAESDGHSVGRNSENQTVVNVPLVNGTEMGVRTFAHDYPSGDGWVAFDPAHEDGDTHRLEVYDPDANSYVQIQMEGTADTYPAVFSEIKSQRGSVQDTLGNTSSGFLADVDEYHATHNVTWAELAVEEPDMQNMTTEEVVRWQLAQYHDGPPQGTVVTVESNGTTYNGTLYTTWAPSTDPDNDSEGEWVTGHQYDAGQGSTYIYTTSGQVKTLSGNMTITAIESPSGDSVDVIDHKDVTLETSDTSDLKQQIDRLNERIKELEQQQNNGGWTIPSLGGSSGMAVIVLLVGVFLLLQNGGGGGTTVLTRRD